MLALLVVSSLSLAANARKESFKMMDVKDLVAAMSSERPPTVCDANSKETRKRVGVIPGAVLLTSSSKYDVAKELPVDRNTPLVFYCANTKCMASHSAAKKAVKAGYTDVSVMADGIFGWKEAGQPTADATL